MQDINAHNWRVQEKDVLFLNTLEVSLVPNPQEGPFHVMCVRKQHTQEPKQPNVCDWNQLSSRVTVPAKPTSKRGHGLELIQTNFASQKKMCEYDGQNATKKKSLLSQTYSFIPFGQ